MKILYLITKADRAGGQIHVLQLVDFFRREFEIHVAAGEDGFLLEEARNLGVTVHRLRHLTHPLKPGRDIRALQEVVGLIRRIKPDLIHAHTSKAGLIGRLGGRFCRVPAVYTAHTWCFAEGTSWTWRSLGSKVERFVARLGGPIINVSEANRELAIRYRIAPGHRLLTIHNGISDEPIEPKPPFPEPRVIMVARFAPQKNQAALLDAAAEVNANFRIQFAGSGPTEPEIRCKVAALGLSDRVDFLGERSDIATLLRGCSVFALSTNWEGLPLSILEAMRAGLPIIASDVGGIRECVIDGENGFLVPRDDVPALANALRQVINNHQMRLRMGLASRRMFEERFTAERMLLETSRVYRNACPV